MISRLRLVHYKGFEDFTIRFGQDALLVGPNNAGKSTIIEALKLCGGAVRQAMRTAPRDAFQLDERWVRGHLLAGTATANFVDENVRHEFREQTTRLELHFKNGATLDVVWPVDADPFFWVEHPRGNQITTAAKAKTALHPIEIVPTLTPIEHDERRLGDDYVAASRQTRLFSRHFRNHLCLAKDLDERIYDEAITYMLERTPELTRLELIHTYHEGGRWLDLYYEDVGSRIQKELYWAGDGLQIWLQVLFHIWYNRQSETLVLDEPDVFLHPDLQRRLIRTLEEVPQQAIMSTHAAEVASEAQHGSVAWVERTRRSAKRVTDDKTMGELTAVLGSGFNLAVARALRSRVALFVEGQDMKLLRVLAKGLNASALAEEKGLTVVPIGGYSHWPSVEAFSWIKQQLLGSAVDVRLLLDRDYRSEETCMQLEMDLRAKKVHAHVWRRKELESYLLEVPLLARATELSEAEIEHELELVLDDLKTSVMAQWVKSELAAKSRDEDVSSAMERALGRFDDAWRALDERLKRAPAKEVISGLNSRLQSMGRKAVTARKLASSIRLDEIDEEMVTAIKEIDEALSQ